MRAVMTTSEMASRGCALEIVQQILRKAQPFDEVLARHKGFSELEKRDRAFVHALVAMTLRRLGQIDAAIKSCLDQAHDLKAPVHDILRLGVAQLLFLGTPAHAAVDTSVELAAAQSATKPFKGLVNAVMRRLTREGAELVKKQDAARLNTPDWLWLSWRKSFGTALARKIAEAHLDEASIDITVREEPSLWAERLKASLLPTGGLRLAQAGVIREMEGFSEGFWWVQDAAATLPVLLMGNLEGKSVFDLCAAPGGKTMQLATRGAKVVAVDRSAPRLERMKENLARLRLDVEIVCRDALTFMPSEKADIVLLDAPCSATGTIRRHPDVLRLKSQEDVDRMSELQGKLLDHAARNLLKDGGQLVYAVCSLQAQEAEEQVDKFLTRWPRFRRVPVEAEEISGIQDMVTEKGDLRCLPSHWPERGGLDGFYVARLESAGR